MTYTQALLDVRRSIKDPNSKDKWCYRVKSTVQLEEEGSDENDDDKVDGPFRMRLLEGVVGIY